MSYLEILTALTLKVNELLDTVKGQAKKWNDAVTVAIERLESWKVAFKKELINLFSNHYTVYIDPSLVEDIYKKQYRTIKGAIDDLPHGGRISIRLLEGGHKIEDHIIFRKDASVKFYGDGYIIYTRPVGEKVLRKFSVDHGYSVVFTFNVPQEVDEAITDIDQGYTSHQSCIFNMGNVEIYINSQPINRRGLVGYFVYHMAQWGGTSCGISAYNASFLMGNEDSFVVGTSGANIGLALNGCSIDIDTQWATGIVKDADSGAYLNLSTNQKLNI